MESEGHLFLPNSHSLVNARQLSSVWNLPWRTAPRGNNLLRSMENPQAFLVVLRVRSRSV